VAKQTVYLPDDLARRLDAAGHRINLSAVFQRALSEELEAPDPEAELRELLTLACAYLVSEDADDITDLLERATVLGIDAYSGRVP
jgi:hypothetical protein